MEARWSTIINTPAPRLNVALDAALHSIAAGSKQLKGCFIEGTFTTRNLAPNFHVPKMETLAAIDYGKIVQNKIWTF